MKSNGRTGSIMKMRKYFKKVFLVKTNPDIEDNNWGRIPGDSFN